MKKEQLLSLAFKRQNTRYEGYASVGDFHDGEYECDHVSPWTIAASNVDADVMIIGQDWSSAENLSACFDAKLKNLGFDSKFPTNRNIDALLWRHFSSRRSECYFTNLFPYIKSGGAGATIPMKDLTYCAKVFTLPEIAIVDPRLVVCLGLRTFRGLASALGLRRPPNLNAAILNPLKGEKRPIHCVAHPGARGSNNRGKDKVDEDWKRLADLLRTSEGSR